MKMKPQVVEETITKVDLSEPQKIEENADQKQETTEVVTDKPTEVIQEVVEEIPSEQNTVQDESTPVIEEITKEEVESKKEIEKKVEKVIEVAKETGEELPEGIQKLVNFMSETGGDINDYVLLNQDYSELDNLSLLEEYYTQTKPHLDREEISFLMDDQFSYNEDADDEKEIKRKKKK